MQLASGSHIPDGLPAAILLLSEKPRHGVASKNPAPHPGIDERNSTLAIDFRAALALNAVRQSERARYYASNDARFMSPDWSSDPEAVPYADLTDPQSLNLYSYVGNNPLSSSDSDGHVQVCGATTVSTDANGDTVVHANCRNVQVDTSFAFRAPQTYPSWDQLPQRKPLHLDEGAITPGFDGLGFIVGWMTSDYAAPRIAVLGLRLAFSSNRPEGVPDNWKKVPDRNGKGFKYQGPNNPKYNYVRVRTDGTIVQVKNGHALDANGNEVPMRSPEAHYPASQFVFRQ